MKATAIGKPAKTFNSPEKTLLTEKKKQIKFTNNTNNNIYIIVKCEMSYIQ